MRFKQFAIFSLCCVLPLAVHAEPNKRDGGGGGGGGNRNGGGEPGMRGKPFSEWTDEEKKQFEQFQKDLAEFCEKNSPSRWNDIKKKDAENPGKHSSMRRQMAWRMGGLKMLQKEDADLYDIKVRQIRVEDDEYRLLKARSAPGDLEKNPDKLAPDAITAQLRETAKRHVELRLAERQHRLAKLNALLKKEQDELASDAKDAETLAQKHFDKIVEQGAVLMPSPPRRERGEGGPGGPGGPSGGPGGGLDRGPGFGGGPDGRPPRDGDKDNK